MAPRLQELDPSRARRESDSEDMRQLDVFRASNIRLYMVLDASDECRRCGAPLYHSTDKEHTDTFSALTRLSVLAMPIVAP